MTVACNSRSYVTCNDVMKKIIIAMASVGLVVVLGLWFFVRPAYKRHKETRAVAQATDAFKKGDFRNASINARRALQINPGNIEACKIMARLAELARSPAALDWHQRIAERAPTLENKLTLASAALRMQPPPYPLASQIIEELASSATNSAAYHMVAAELALKLKKLSDAESHFLAAQKLEPTNQLHQINVAVLRLQSTNQALVAEARATLDGLKTSPNFGTVALRWLVADHALRGDFATAKQYSLELLAQPNALWEDRIEHLNILFESKSPEFGQWLKTLQEHALTNATAIHALSAWMLRHNMLDESMAWLNSLPASIRTQQPVPLALTDAYLARKDWAGLEAFLQQEKWGDIEYLRLAFLSRASAELKQDLAAKRHWRAAVRSAGDRLAPLTGLFSLASSWKLHAEAEDILWQIHQKFPRERWVLAELDRLYIATGNTRGLNKLYSTMAWYDDKNYVVKNNLAATSLLLKVNLAQAHEIARELYNSHPEDPVIASTYAYSLHLQGRTQAGLHVLEKLKPEELEMGSVATYYGLLLAAVGDNARAKIYLNIAKQSHLLPEEQALVEEAFKQL